MNCKYDCFITRHAEQDLDDIMQYIMSTLCNPSAARSLSAHIFDNIEHLSDFPHMGTPVENDYILDKSIRRLIVDDHIIYYKADDETRKIYIVRVVYGRRDQDEVLRTVN